MMRIRTPGRGRPRRGATRRRPRRRLDWATFDRWLDRVVIVAVGIALIVGILALILSLLL
ncbi:hypothetical protein [Halomonas cerina]|uniref:Uncharacterized protein n=1 Tax=Halomonas cerina TaxID=447424 RepID=A0A839VIH4_9GAMM|nr:hypothetical protein [Halomonas cerina]MBB3192384.1 hypothetical protein [Halomonas cerina]